MNAADTQFNSAHSDQHRHFVCWHSVIAGLIVSLVSYMIFAALGTGIGGLSAQHIIGRSGEGTGLATGAAIWLGLSCAVSLFLATYFSVRMATRREKKIGAAYGVIITGLFFTLLLFTAGKVLGSVTRGVGAVTAAAASSASDLASSDEAQDAARGALGSANLKSPAPEVAQGISARLLRGDTEGAKRYYAYQTGQTPAEAEAKVNQLKAQLDQAAENAAGAAAAIGWTLFVVFSVSLLAAMLGGYEAAGANMKRRIDFLPSGT
jgi:enamine deaminase RidA (YjgF/YER057c/UK114 family)